MRLLPELLALGFYKSTSCPLLQFFFFLRWGKGRSESLASKSSSLEIYSAQGQQAKDLRWLFTLEAGVPIRNPIYSVSHSATGEEGSGAPALPCSS